MAYLVVFDVDGTLVDSQHAILGALHQAFAAHALEAPSRDRLLSIVGLSLPMAIERLMPDQPAPLIASLSEAYKTGFAENRRSKAHEEPLFPGAREMIEMLAGRSDVVLGIATGKSRRGVDMLIERERLQGLFATIQTADNAPSKPHPAMLEQAMSATGIGPAATIMIGDTSFDMEMAVNARVGAIGVAWGYHPMEELIGAGADVVVKSFAELRREIERRHRAEAA